MWLCVLFRCVCVCVGGKICNMNFELRTMKQSQWTLWTIEMKWKKVSFLSEAWIRYHSSYIIFLYLIHFNSRSSLQREVRIIIFQHISPICVWVCYCVAISKFLFSVVYTYVCKMYNNNRLNDGITKWFLLRSTVTYLIVFMDMFIQWIRLAE